ncbi:RDD family protein [Nonomuraea sp. MCN248]|uniref:RDD family protein n=1 Tax=Nonomuraea corallina TaxID=2989783 RepID=A0ABT4S560_9ACTN|nr:RDD family protein [Nonomuraea corallina]MDA0632338.1 RDD family protein [Nonomuraea corallina]
MVVVGEQLTPETLEELEWGTTDIYGMVRAFGSVKPTPVLSALADDLGMIAELAYTWALPALLVLAGFLGCLRQSDPEALGRRVAWGLVAVAAAGPVTAVDLSLTVLSPEWFAAMADCWGRDQVCYLLAALLVLAASLGMPRRPGPAPEGTGLRAAALLADYVIFSVALGLVTPLLSDSRRFLHSDGFRGLLSLLEPEILPSGDELATLGLLFLYVWIPRGTTVGKRLVGLRVEGAGAGKAALRALLFPVAVLWPVYGVLWLAADVLWSFVDRDGRMLHDRLLGTSVTFTRGHPATLTPSVP